MPKLGELGSKVGPSVFWVKKCLFSTLIQDGAIARLKLIRVENGVYNLKKVGPSSQRLGTCRGQNSFTLAYQTSALKTVVLNVCGPHMIKDRYSI